MARKTMLPPLPRANDGVPHSTLKNWEKAGGKAGAVAEPEREAE